MEMFERLHDTQIIHIWEGGQDNPSELNNLVLGLRKSQNSELEPSTAAVVGANKSRAKFPIWRNEEER